jgi:hypothetical protein
MLTSTLLIIIRANHTVIHIEPQSQDLELIPLCTLRGPLVTTQFDPQCRLYKQTGRVAVIVRHSVQAFALPL